MDPINITELAVYAGFAYFVVVGIIVVSFTIAAGLGRGSRTGRRR